MSFRMLVVATTLLSLTACSLDDPFGAKKRLSEQRRAECQQIFAVTETDYTQRQTVSEQEDLSLGGHTTQKGHLWQADTHVQTADRLEALDLNDENLERFTLHLAVSYRGLAEQSRDLAPFAEIERTITSANDRSPEHQAVVARETSFKGIDYALEVYCEGGDAPQVLWEISSLNRY